MFYIGVFQSITTHVIEQSDGIATDLLFKQQKICTLKMTIAIQRISEVDLSQGLISTLFTKN